MIWKKVFYGQITISSSFRGHVFMLGGLFLKLHLVVARPGDTIYSCQPSWRHNGTFSALLDIVFINDETLQNAKTMK